MDIDTNNTPNQDDAEVMMNELIQYACSKLSWGEIILAVFVHTKNIVSFIMFVVVKRHTLFRYWEQKNIVFVIWFVSLLLWGLFIRIRQIWFSSIVTTVWTIFISFPFVYTLTNIIIRPMIKKELPKANAAFIIVKIIVICTVLINIIMHFSKMFEKFFHFLEYGDAENINSWKQLVDDIWPVFTKNKDPKIRVINGSIYVLFFGIYALFIHVWVKREINKINK